MPDEPEEEPESEDEVEEDVSEFENEDDSDEESDIDWEDVALDANRWCGLSATRARPHADGYSYQYYAYCGT